MLFVNNLIYPFSLKWKLFRFPYSKNMTKTRAFDLAEILKFCKECYCMTLFIALSIIVARHQIWSHTRCITKSFILMTIDLLKTVSESKNNFTTHIWFGSVLRRVFQIHSSYYAVVFNIISCSSRNSFKNIVIEGIRWGVMILLVFFLISPIFSF